MTVYIVFEYLDYYKPDVVRVFSKENAAQEYVEKHFWRDENGAGIYYEAHEIEE